MLTHPGIWIIALFITIIYELFAGFDLLYFLLFWIICYIVLYIVIVIPAKKSAHKKEKSEGLGVLHDDTKK